MKTALVTDGKYRSSIAAVRALHRAGYQVIVTQTRADAHAVPAVAASRCCAAFRWIDGAAAEPFAAVDPRKLRIEAVAGASARIVVLHTAADMSVVEVELGEEAQLELTELFTAEAFAEVSVKQAARSRCRLTTVQLSSANASYRIDLDGADWAGYSSPRAISTAW